MAGQPHSMKDTVLQPSPLMALGAKFRANAREARAALRENDEKACLLAWRRLVKIWDAMQIFMPADARERRVFTAARRFELTWFGGAQRMRLLRREQTCPLAGQEDREMETVR